MTALNLIFQPQLPAALLIALGVLAAAVVLLMLLRHARHMGWRLLAMACFALALAQPLVLTESREPARPTVLIFVDRSASMLLGDRAQLGSNALLDLQKSLKELGDLDVREIDFGSAARSALLPSLQAQLSQIPEDRLAGIFVITDGQVQDLKEDLEQVKLAAPVHILLTGKEKEFDRRLIVQQAPAYALAGTAPAMRVQVVDAPEESGSAVLVIKPAGGKEVQVTVPVGEATDVTLPELRAGLNTFQVSAALGANELTNRNNQALISVNGIRETLKVLLVSGEPHVGERTWRNLLKSDPAVNLIHFTILRSPDKQTDTPSKEMSLISFPVNELFETKLDEFDLVIFDRMQQLMVLPNALLANVAKYVQAGGALLDVAGPVYATPLGLQNTPIAAVLPTQPTGDVIEKSFVPALTSKGERHPVTAGLTEWRGGTGNEAPWGSWLRQIAVRQMWGETLMTGADGQPLLIVGEQKHGRVAQLLSDQIWLWTRGYEGGGPQADLLRRLAHWLMQEPELETEALRGTAIADGSGYKLHILRRSLGDTVAPVSVTTPDGTVQTVPLAFRASDGYYAAEIPATDVGIYRLDDGFQQALVMVGAQDGPEWREVRATPDHLTPVADASRGEIVWLGERDKTPTLRLVEGRDFGGGDWLGLRNNRAYTVTGTETAPFLPSWLMLALLLGVVMLVWWREGRK